MAVEQWFDESRAEDDRSAHADADRDQQPPWCGRERSSGRSGARFGTGEVQQSARGEDDGRTGVDEAAVDADDECECAATDTGDDLGDTDEAATDEVGDDR